MNICKSCWWCRYVGFSAVFHRFHLFEIRFHRFGFSGFGASLGATIAIHLMLCMQICGRCWQCRWENMSVVRFLWVRLVSTRDWLFKSDRTWFEWQTSRRGGTTRAAAPAPTCPCLTRQWRPTAAVRRGRARWASIKITINRVLKKINK